MLILYSYENFHHYWLRLASLGDALSVDSLFYLEQREETGCPISKNLMLQMAALRVSLFQWTSDKRWKLRTPPPMALPAKLPSARGMRSVVLCQFLSPYVPYLDLPDGRHPAARSHRVNNCLKHVWSKRWALHKDVAYSLLSKREKYSQQCFLPSFSSPLGKHFSRVSHKMFAQGASVKRLPVESWDGLPVQSSRAHTEAAFDGRWLFSVWAWKKGRWVAWMWFHSRPEMFCTWPCFCFSLREWF